jgi:hypothetical protein
MLREKWKVFESRYPAEGSILMGHKDNRQHYLAGYFYCPYVPFSVQLDWDDKKQQWHNILWLRYGKKLIDSNFYGVIDISNLPKTQTEEPAPEAAEEVQ